MSNANTLAYARSFLVQLSGQQEEHLNPRLLDVFARILARQFTEEDHLPEVGSFGVLSSVFSFIATRTEAREGRSPLDKNTPQAQEAAHASLPSELKQAEDDSFYLQLDCCGISRSLNPETFTTLENQQLKVGLKTLEAYQSAGHSLKGQGRVHVEVAKEATDEIENSAAFDLDIQAHSLVFGFAENDLLTLSDTSRIDVHHLEVDQGTVNAARLSSGQFNVSGEITLNSNLILTLEQYQSAASKGLAFSSRSETPSRVVIVNDREKMEVIAHAEVTGKPEDRLDDRFQESRKENTQEPDPEQPQPEPEPEKVATGIRLVPVEADIIVAPTLTLRPAKEEERVVVPERQPEPEQPTTPEEPVTPEPEQAPAACYAAAPTCASRTQGNHHYHRR